MDEMRTCRRVASRKRAALDVFGLYPTLIDIFRIFTIRFAFWNGLQLIILASPLSSSIGPRSRCAKRIRLMMRLIRLVMDGIYWDEHPNQAQTWMQVIEEHPNAVVKDSCSTGIILSRHLCMASTATASCLVNRLRKPLTPK
jgi:hypothetical protein